MKILEVDGLVSGYTDTDILRGASIYVQSGEIVCIIGPNGAGKSTLLKTIIGILHPRKGRIRYKGKDIGSMAPDRIATLGIGYVPQEKNVFPSLTVLENLEMGAFLRTKIDVLLDEVCTLFPVLKEKNHVRASMLSGGEVKMLAMGRAMMLEPDLLLLDEPTAGLSPKFRTMVFGKINDINRRGTTVLMVEQNAKKALSISSRGYVLEMGQNRFEGAGLSLLDNENVLELYLGK